MPAKSNSLPIQPADTAQLNRLQTQTFRKRSQASWAGPLGSGPFAFMGEGAAWTAVVEQARTSQS